MRFETWTLDKVEEFAGNPRHHPPEVVAQMASALKRFGFRVPLIVNEADSRLIDGHLRVKAAKVAGLADVPVLVVDDMSEQDIEAFRVSVNRMAELADWDEDALTRTLESLESQGEKLGAAGPIGFDLESLSMEPGELEPWDFSLVADKFVVTVTGTLPLEAEVRKRLAGLAGVTIEASSLEVSS